VTVPFVPLNSGARIPQLGFGVYKVPADDRERVVSTALELGYRHIDTAKVYRNEAGVGAAIAASGIPRDELFVTTKLWNSDHGRDAARPAIELSLEKLGLDRVDLYLIHWPVPSKRMFVETWHALEEIQALGLATSIGVSNFLPHHLQPLLDAATVVPAVNQIELHPYYQERDAVAFNGDHGIVTEAWAPLGQGALVDEAGVTAIAESYGKSLAQVILRWHIQRGTIVIPKSVHRERMAENIDIFDFELTEAEVRIIDALERGGRVDAHPDDV